MNRLAPCLIAAAALFAAGAAPAQQVLLDRGVFVEGLQCFPSAIDDNHWYYVPQRARLAQDESGEPVFSFIRYVVNRPSDEGDTKGITDAAGGGIVTTMVTYDTPEELVRKAEQALKRKNPDKPDLSLRGPVSFKEGRYVLVSSILRETGEDGKEVLATGTAPVFEGNEVAFSLEVDPRDSKLLLESFKMDTPDVSFMFDMTLEGLADAYDATMVVNWEEVKKHKTFGGGVGVARGLVSAEVEKTFDDLMTNNAVQVVTRGSNPNMEALLNRVQSKLIALMFEKEQPERQPQRQGGGGLTDMVTNMITGGEEGGFAKNLSMVSFSVKYKLKDIKKTGTTRLHFNSQAPMEINTTMVANIGDLYARYGEDGNRFRTVNLADPAYQQREIHVGIDGAILPEFDKYINSVTVTLRKIHQNGAQTLQEIVVDRNTFNRESRDFRMVYGWNGDADRDAWLEYDYRTRWSFKGGGLLETDWARTETNMIDLYAPYRRNTVELIGDSETLKEKGVRAIAVNVEYDFFDGRRSQELALPTSQEIDGKEMEITLPLNVYDYDYTVTWVRRGKPPLVSQGTDDTGVIFVDDLPEEPIAETGTEAGG